MKARIIKLALAIAFMALPTVGSAQGVLGTILQGLQQGVQQVLEQQRQQLRQQQQSQQRNYNNNGGYSNRGGGFTGNANSGLLIDQTYVEGGGSTYAPPVTSSPSGSTSRMCSACGGRGVCNACRNHIGKATASSNSPDCNACNGKGLCYICNGTGRVSN